MFGQYSFTHIKRMEPLMDARMYDWLDKIYERSAKTGKPLEFSRWAVLVNILAKSPSSSQERQRRADFG